jgi:phenylalanyl-tRNA synthetase beta chain
MLKLLILLMLNFFKNLFSKKTQQTNFTNILAAKVISVEKHPNADRLRVITLDIGRVNQARDLPPGANEVYPVVCGAFNFGEGDMVALALPGAQITQNIHSETHEPFVLGKAKIRGIESQGMICAAFELGLSKEPGEKPGIMLLKSDVLPGSEFSPSMVKSL